MPDAPIQPDPNAAAPGGAAAAAPPPATPATPPAKGAPASPSGAPAGGGGAPEPTAIGEGGDLGPEGEPQAIPANWPGNWREIMAGGDAKALQRLNRYASPANVWKALQASGAKISSGELLRAKPDGTDEQALNEWRAQAGVPEKPEGYLEKLPDGLVIGEQDQGLVDSFIADMHAADTPPALVHKALSWYYGNQEKMTQQLDAADKQNKATAEDTLHADWGPEYRPNINGVLNLVAAHGAEGLIERMVGARTLDGHKLGNDPEFWKLMVALNREVNPHGTVVPTAGQTAAQTIKSEIADLEAKSADTRGPYWNGPQAEAMQARLRELYDMESRQQRKAG